MQNDGNQVDTGAIRPRPAGGERHATWLELFFDLVFVAAITMVSSQLRMQSTVTGVLGYLGLFVPICWAWLGHMVYSNRFATEDRVHHGLTFVIMLAALVMAVQVPQIGANGGQAFALAYCTARACLLMLYWRVRHRPYAQALSHLYLWGFGLGLLVWLVSLFVPPPARYVCWVVGSAIDLVTPWVGRTILQRWPLNVSHLPERMGLFVLIVLGESVVSIVDGLRDVVWAIAPVLVAILAFGIAACIWWLYFSFLKVVKLECSLGSGQPYLYSHWPFVLGVTALAAGVEPAIRESGEPAFTATTLVLLGCGATLWFGSMYLIKLASYGRLPVAETAAYAGACVATMVLVGAGRHLPPLAIIGGLAAIFAVTVLMVWRSRSMATL